jgi:hypothetical protein
MAWGTAPSRAGEAPAIGRVTLAQERSLDSVYALRLLPGTTDMNRFTFTVAGAMLASVTATPAATAQKALPTVEQQIATTVLTLPEAMRTNATIMGYRSGTKLEVLRQGTNGMNCLALFAIEENFHIACYHEGMEPFMLRGRQLRAQGVTGAQVDSVRYREVREGKLPMPTQAAMYQLFGNKTSWDVETGKLSGTRSLFVMYIPGATALSTGLSTNPPAGGGPWLMNPGTPKAHIMLQGTMTP